MQIINLYKFIKLYIFFQLLIRSNANYVIPENAVLTDMHAVYHAYENSWNIQFSNLNDVEFHIVVVEICSQFQNQQTQCENDVPQTSTIVTCADLLQQFQQENWHNTFLSKNNFEILTSTFCEDVKQNPLSVQTGVDTILTDQTNMPLIFLRQPMTIVVKNTEEVLQKWVRQDKVTDESILHFTVYFRVTQVLSLQHNFVIHQSISSIQIAQPLESLMTFSVQNPCTNIGYSAPKYGAVSLLHISNDKRCVWQCREDMLRVPYNSIPPTINQLNLSDNAYKSLNIKYSCFKPPANVIVFVFGFVLETYMISSTYGYSQEFFDALDVVSSQVQKDIPTSNVFFAIPNSLYHSIDFNKIIREKLKIACVIDQCTNIWYPTEDGWINTNYLYAGSNRRLLHTYDLHSIVVEGMLVIDDLLLLTDSNYRSQMIEQLRQSLYRHFFSMQQNFTNLQIMGVEDIDIQRIVGFVQKLPSTSNVVNDVEKPSALSSQNPNITLLIIASTMMSFVVLILCVLQIYDKFRVRHFDPVSTTD